MWGTQVGPQEGWWGLPHPRGGHGSGLLLIVSHAGSRDTREREQMLLDSCWQGTGTRSLLRQTVRKKRNLSPGSIFTSMTRRPFSSLSWQSTSKCMSCICIYCCFLISSQCRDVMKTRILKLQMSLHQKKPTGIYQGEGCLQMPPYSFSRGLSWCLWWGKPRVAEGRMRPWLWF